MLNALADELDVDLGLPAAEARPGPSWPLGTSGAEPPAGPHAGRARRGPAGDRRRRAVLATWHELIDGGRCRTASRTWPAPPSRCGRCWSAATAAELGVVDGDLVTVSTARGSLTAPAVIATMR